MLDVIINTNLRWERPKWIAVDGFRLSVGRRVKEYASDRRRRIAWWRENAPEVVERVDKAGRWITPEEGTRLYGSHPRVGTRSVAEGTEEGKRVYGQAGDSDSDL